MSSFTTDPIVIMRGMYQWELFAPFTYYREPRQEGNNNTRTFESIVVPKGFVTDLASVPRMFWSLFPPHDTYAKAAILHDYLYENAIGTKEEADEIFYEAMGVLGVPNWKRKIIYFWVKKIGKGKY